MTELLLAPDRRPSPEEPRFVFGGARFEIYPSPGMGWELGDEHRLFSAPTCDAPALATVHCVVVPAPELEEGDLDRAIRWSWTGERDEASLQTARVDARVRRLGARRYVVTASVAPSTAGCSSLLTALAALVAFREGGLVLHAAGVEIDGAAVLFIGPSGAGKTTSASLCTGARWLARDRAAVYPAEGRWWAAGLCGGDEVPLDRSPLLVAPLAAVLRVQRGVGEPRIAREDRWRALFDLRESVQACGPAEEDRHLEHALALIDSARVGRAATVLGAPLTERVRAWLGST